MRRRFVLYVLLILPLSLWASGSVNNIGFEDENGFNGWRFYTGNVRGDSIFKTSIYDPKKFSEVSTPSEYSDVFKLYFNSPGGFLADKCDQHEIPQNSGMGNKFLRLGDKSAGSNCEKVSYSFQYSENMSSVIRYAYAMVLQEPTDDNHKDNQRPSFIASIMIVRDKGNGKDTITKNDICTIEHYYANQELANLQLCRDAGKSYDYNILVTPWLYNTFDLKALNTTSGFVSVQEGDFVTLSFATFDCTRNGHSGYAYVDAEFVNSKFEIEGGGSNAVCVGDNVTFRYPGAGTFTGETYEWKVGDNIVSTDSSMSHTFSQSGDYVVSLTISVDGGNTCIQARTMTETIHVMNCICPDNGKITIDGVSVDESFSVCKDQLLQIGFQAGIPLINPQYVWTFGNNSLNEGNESQDGISNFSASTQGTLALQVTSNGCKAGVNFAINLNVENCLANSCNDCPSRFSPTPGEKYTLSGWVSAEDQIGRMDSFEKVYILLVFNLIGSDTPDSVKCYPDGNIIDGWQRISKNFVIPQDAEKMRIALKNESGDNRVYFDDIRFHPFNASVKSYVYDPKTLRLAAELDDENYATFYEYDEEGALVRIKKETERGVMTIREARQSKPKN